MIPLLTLYNDHQSHRPLIAERDTLLLQVGLVPQDTSLSPPQHHPIIYTVYYHHQSHNTLIFSLLSFPLLAHFAGPLPQLLHNATINNQTMMIILNFGLHIHRTNQYKALCRRIFPVFLDYATKGKHIVMFRETSAQHFHTSNGLFPYQNYGKNIPGPFSFTPSYKNTASYGNSPYLI